jgi:hypothetical protein
MLRTLLLDSDSSVTGFLVLIHWSFWMSLLACWNNARVTAVVAQSYMHYWALHGLLRTWNSWSHMIESVFIDRIDTVHIFNHLWMLVTDSFSAIRNPTTAHCLKCNHNSMPFWWPPVHVQEYVLFCCPAVASRTSKSNHRKNFRFFLLILTSLESVAKLFGNP